MLGTGTIAPDFELPRFGGGKQSLTAALHHGPVVLVFFKASCPTCQLTLPFLERIRQAQRKPFQLVLISQEKENGTHAFHAEFGITALTLLDTIPGYPASNAYEISSVPSLFLIGTDGRIEYAEAGFDREQLRRWGSESGIEMFVESQELPAFQHG
jgi:peroxiredoxin